MLRSSNKNDLPNKKIKFSSITKEDLSKQELFKQKSSEDLSKEESSEDELSSEEESSINIDSPDNEFQFRVIDNGKERIITSSHFHNKINFFGEIITLEEFYQNIKNNILIYLDKYDSNNYTLIIFFIIFKVRNKLKTYEDIYKYLFKKKYLVKNKSFNDETYINSKKYHDIANNIKNIIDLKYKNNDNNDEINIFNDISSEMSSSNYDFIYYRLRWYANFQHYFEKTKFVVLHTSIKEVYKFIYDLIHFNDNVMFSKFFLENIFRVNTNSKNIFWIQYNNLYYFFTDDIIEIISTNHEMKKIFQNTLIKARFNYNTNRIQKDDPNINKLILFLKEKGKVFN